MYDLNNADDCRLWIELCVYQNRITIKVDPRKLLDIEALMIARQLFVDMDDVKPKKREDCH